MVASNVIIRVLITLASSTALTVSASPVEPGIHANLSQRDDQDANASHTVILSDPKYYHYGQYPEQELKKEDATKQKMILQQPLSMAQSWGDGSGKAGAEVDYDFFWFADKNPVYEDDGPGNGCEVSLYFDNILERAKAAKSQNYDHDRYSDRSELTWAVPSAMTPRCNPGHSDEEIKAYALEKDYKDGAVGYIHARPDDEEAYNAAVWTLG